MAKKSTKRTETIITVIVVIAILLVVGFGTYLLLRPHDYSYRGFPFQKTACPSGANDCWATQFMYNGELHPAVFYNHPKDLENVTVAREVLALPQLSTVRNHALYLALPPNAPAKVFQSAELIARFLGTNYNIFNINTKAALYGSGPDQVTCANASGNTVVLSFEQGTTDSVFIRAPNCIVVQSIDETHSIMVSEALTYHLLGIMPTYTYQLPQNGTIARPANMTISNASNATLL